MGTARRTRDRAFDVGRIEKAAAARRALADHGRREQGALRPAGRPNGPGWRSYRRILEKSNFPRYMGGETGTRSIVGNPRHRQIRRVAARSRGAKRLPPRSIW